MKILTENQRRVLREVERAETPLTVAELAKAAYLSPSSARNALMTLSRYGCVRVAGSALSGGQTWAPMHEGQSS